MKALRQVIRDKVQSGVIARGINKQVTPITTYEINQLINEITAQIMTINLNDILEEEYTLEDIQS